MCRVPGCSGRPGGGRLGASFTTLCNHHKQRDRRHGDARQQPIRVAHLAPYVRALKRRQKLRPDAPAWAALEARWEGVVRACRGTLKVHEAGLPGIGWEVEAAGELVKVAEQATAEAVWHRALSLFMLRAAEPHMFVSEKAFRVQLGRLCRHLADTSRASYFNSRLGRLQHVYRDPAPRAAFIVGDMLTEAFGVAGEWLARQEAAEAEAKATERSAFYEAMRDIAPAGAAL